MLVVLDDGGRLAAAQRRAQRQRRHHARPRRLHALRGDQRGGCPKEPTWQITAVRVVHDPARERISYGGATLNLFGAADHRRCPAFSHPDRRQGGGSGLLVPGHPLQPQQRAGASAPYYLRLAPNRDADDHAARLHRACCRCWRREYRAADRPRRLPGRAATLTYGSQRAALGDPASPSDEAISRLSRGQRPLSARARPGASPARAATSPTAPSCAATTSRATTGCARSSEAERIGTRQLYLDRRLGVPEACASTDRRRAAADRAARRSTARWRFARPAARRAGRASGQQPAHHPHRGPGHAARLRQRALGPAPADAAGARK